MILESKIVKMLDLWHPRKLHASKICRYTVYGNDCVKVFTLLELFDVY